MTETTLSRLVKLNRLNVEQYENYSSKFELRNQRNVDFIADFTHVQYALRLRQHVFAMSLVVENLLSCTNSLPL